MNKKEVAEIKKHFSDNSDLFVMNRVLTAVVDSNANVKYSKVASPINMDEHEQNVYYHTLRKILSTKISKQLIEYAFPNTAYFPGNAQNILYNVVQSGFQNDSDNDLFISNIVDNLNYTGPYAIISAYCSYTVFSKDKSDEINEYNTEDYKFIITAICPIESGDGALAYSFFDDKFISHADTKLFIDKSPSDGFLFPAFNDRSSDVNYVMYYTKNHKELNTSLVEDVLGCSFTLTPEQEKLAFRSIMETVFGDDLSYECIIEMNSKIQQYIDNHKKSTEHPVINKNLLRLLVKELFTTFDLDERKLLTFDSVYDQICGSATLSATNLVDSKLTLTLDGVSLNVKDSDACHVIPYTLDDRLHTRIEINVTEPTFEINGMHITANK